MPCRLEGRCLRRGRCLLCGSVENDRARESTVGSAGMTDDQKPDDVAEEGDQIDYDPDDEVDIEINRTAWLFREFITLPTKE